MYILVGLFLVGIGLLMLLCPEVFYNLTESWKQQGSGEPSKLYLFSTRFGGIMFILAGLCGIVL